VDALIGEVTADAETRSKHRWVQIFNGVGDDPDAEGRCTVEFRGSARELDVFAAVRRAVLVEAFGELYPLPLELPLASVWPLTAAVPRLQVPTTTTRSRWWVRARCGWHRAPGPKSRTSTPCPSRQRRTSRGMVCSRTPCLSRALSPARSGSTPLTVHRSARPSRHARRR